ncbi:MAG TPA: archaeosortase/exosortase family protein [Ferruginibacter sp.]|mgnify:CR=1 FL=1|nr:archaeosortase/exosortase family protein [Ferruginibacter sp.]HMP21251.1 archaeosortase/exosortase family protein [Ferruginibacter sp.]
MQFRKLPLGYIARFLGSFCLLYFGTYLLIGISTPGGSLYSSFIDEYLNYVHGLRRMLLNGSRLILSVFGYEASIENMYDLRLKGGSRVHMVYSCLGIGLLSFWLAFIYANAIGFRKSLLWMTSGVFMICLLNIARVSLLLLSNNYRWGLFRNVNHHTMFNIAVYILIFFMMWIFDRCMKKTATP